MTQSHSPQVVADFGQSLFCVVVVCCWFGPSLPRQTPSTGSKIGLEQIDVTFRRIRQNVASCPLLRTGVALFFNVCAGFVDCCCKVCGERRLVGFLGAPSPAGFPLHVYRITQVCLSLDGGRRWWHHLRSPLGVDVREWFLCAGCRLCRFWKRCSVYGVVLEKVVLTRCCFVLWK